MLNEYLSLGWCISIGRTGRPMFICQRGRKSTN